MPELETLIASLFYLMTRHGQSSKANVEQAVADHLQMLAKHPDCDSRVLKDAGHRLAITWQQEARIKKLRLDKTEPSHKVSKSIFVH